MRLKKIFVLTLIAALVLSVSMPAFASRSRLVASPEIRNGYTAISYRMHTTPGGRNVSHYEGPLSVSRQFQTRDEAIAYARNRIGRSRLNPPIEAPMYGSRLVHRPSLIHVNLTVMGPDVFYTRRMNNSLTRNHVAVFDVWVVVPTRLFTGNRR